MRFRPVKYWYAQATRYLSRLTCCAACALNSSATASPVAMLTTIQDPQDTFMCCFPYVSEGARISWRLCASLDLRLRTKALTGRSNGGGRACSLSEPTQLLSNTICGLSLARVRYGTRNACVCRMSCAVLLFLTYPRLSRTAWLVKRLFAVRLIFLRVHRDGEADHASD